MKVKVRTQTKNKTFGQDRFLPDCPITRAVAEIRTRPCVNMRAIEAFIKNGFDIEYVGIKNPGLDSRGAKYLEEKDRKAEQK